MGSYWEGKSPNGSSISIRWDHTLILKSARAMKTVRDLLSRSQTNCFSQASTYMDSTLELPMGLI